jgi:hypothetical protein
VKAIPSPIYLQVVGAVGAVDAVESCPSHRVRERMVVVEYLASLAPAFPSAKTSDSFRRCSEASSDRSLSGGIRRIACTVVYPGPLPGAGVVIELGSRPFSGPTTLGSLLVGIQVVASSVAVPPVMEGLGGQLGSQ